MCLGLSAILPVPLEISKGLPPPVVGLAPLELSLVVALLVVETLDVVDDRKVAEEVAIVVEMLDCAECVDDEFGVVVELVGDIVMVVLDAEELTFGRLLLLPDAPVPHPPPPPPLAGGVQRNVVAAWSKKSPIRVFGDAPVPWHALMIVMVTESSALEQAEEQEQSWPLLKWALSHSLMEVL